MCLLVRCSSIAREHVPGTIQKRKKNYDKRHLPGTLPAPPLAFSPSCQSSFYSCRFPFHPGRSGGLTLGVDLVQKRELDGGQWRARRGIVQ
jgi:hypothetical protein